MPTQVSLPTTLKLLALGLTLVGASVAVACGDLGAALEGAECFSASDDEDCGPLNCVAPNPSIEGTPMNTTGLGWCSESASCEPGGQPFCGCVLSPATNEVSCATPFMSGNIVGSTLPCAASATDLSSCLCLPPEVTCPYNPDMNN